MVIVTQNQYILAHKINHITMDEQVQYHEVRSSSGRYRTVIDKYFQITVIYIPEQTQANSSNGREPDPKECSVIIRGAASAHKVFANLIQQIREQMPDQLYLDTALERMLAGVNMEELVSKQEKEEDCWEDDVKAVQLKATSVGKAKKKRLPIKKVKRLRK